MSQYYIYIADRNKKKEQTIVINQPENQEASTTTTDFAEEPKVGKKYLVVF